MKSWKRIGVVLVSIVISLLVIGCPSPVGDDGSSGGGGTTSGDGSGATQAITLSLDTWETATIGLDSQLWFSASVSAGSAYRISWDDADGTGTYGVDLVIDAYHSDGTTTYFSDSDFGDGSNSDDTTYKDVHIAAGEDRIYIVADSEYFSESGTFRVRISEVNLTYEGSVESPIQLTAGQAHSGKVGDFTGLEDDYTSFYTFTTSTAGDYSIAASDVSPSGYDFSYAVYTGSDFYTGEVAYETNDTGITDLTLDGTTTYYVEIINFGSSAVTYTLTVTAPSGGGTTPSATLSGLSVTDASDNPIALSPVFSADTGSYTASVANSVSEVTVAATSTEATATVQVNDNTSTMAGYDEATVTLPVGDTTVTVSVDDGTGTGTYTIVITRAEAGSVQIGSWSQIGSGAIGLVGTTTYNDPSLAFDTNFNPYVAYIDGDTKDVGVKRSTDGSTWSAVGGSSLKDFYNGLTGSMDVDVAVTGSETAGRVYVTSNVSTTLFYMLATNAINLSTDSWEGPYGTTMTDYDASYLSWGYEDKGHFQFVLNDTFYLAYDDSGSNDDLNDGFVLLSNDGTSVEFTEELSNAGVDWTYNLAVKDLNNMAVGDYTWNGTAGLYDLTVYTGNTSTGFSQVDTATINTIATGDGLMALDLAYNPSSGNLGVVVSDDGGLTRLYENNGSSWSQIGGDIVAAADATSYSFVWLAYSSTGTPSVLLGNSGGTWTGGKRYNSTSSSWEALTDAPNSATKVSDVAFANGTLYVCGAYNNGTNYEARVWTFAE